MPPEHRLVNGPTLRTPSSTVMRHARQSAKWPLRRLYFGSIVTLSGSIALLRSCWGPRQFAGIDSSINMNGAWQLVHGRVPYRDFLTGLPLTTLALLRLSYSIAPNFQSMLIVNGLLTFASCVAIALLATSRFRGP